MDDTIICKYSEDNNIESIFTRLLSHSNLMENKVGIYLFGTGLGGQVILNYCRDRKWDSKIVIKGFFDNNLSRQEKKINNVQVILPQKDVIEPEDFVIIASLDHGLEMNLQLAEMGVLKNKIILPYGWLENLLQEEREKKLVIGNHGLDNAQLLRETVNRVCNEESCRAKEYIYKSLSRKSLLIPLHYEYTVQQPPIDYIYTEVKNLLDNSMDSILKYYESIKPYFMSDKLSEVAHHKENEVDPYWNNTFFTSGDARALYAIVAAYRPHNVIEVGVGNSTKFIRKAITDYGLTTKIMSIDPEPRADIQLISDQVIRENILNIDLDIVTRMKKGDIFFVDGSHLLHCGTDVAHYFLNVFPKIPSGVLVHIHDVCLPYEYPVEFRIRHYNEQYMLASMLLYTNQWEIVFPVHYLNKMGYISNGGASFWIRKI